MDEIIKILFALYVSIFFCFSSSYLSTEKMISFFLQEDEKKQVAKVNKKEKKNYLQEVTDSFFFNAIKEILEFVQKMFSMIEVIIGIIR